MIKIKINKIEFCRAGFCVCVLLLGLFFGEQNIFAVGMGVMIEDSLEKISSSLEEFLLVKKGMFNY